MTQAANSTYMGMAAGLNLYGGVYVVAPAVNNPSEDYGINGYFESHLKGTLAGHTYGGGFWINIDDNFVDLAGGYFIAAQDNGIYEATATTVTNALYIYGMRAEIVMTSTPSAGAYMFSSNSNNLLISSLFRAADGGNSIGYVVSAEGPDVASIAAGTIKFATLSDGTVLYVHAYSSAS